MLSFFGISQKSFSFFPLKTPFLKTHLPVIMDKDIEDIFEEFRYSNSKGDGKTEFRRDFGSKEPSRFNSRTRESPSFSVINSRKRQKSPKQSLFDEFSRSFGSTFKDEPKKEEKTQKGKGKSPKDKEGPKEKGENKGKSQKETPAIVDLTKRFNEFYKEIKEMRKDRSAPVDKFGVEAHFDATIPEKTRNLHILTSLVLSVQTKDETNFKAMQKLKEFGLSLEKIIETPEAAMKELVGSVNYSNTKIAFLKRIAKEIKENHSGEIPSEFSDLVKLPGIGAKIAHLYLQIALGKVEGVSVDTHVHRISNRLGFCQTKNPEGTRMALEKIVPKQDWKDVNYFLVGFGQQICQPRNPLCHKCSLESVCPEAKAAKKEKEEGKIKKRTSEETDEE